MIPRVKLYKRLKSLLCYLEGIRLCKAHSSSMEDRQVDVRHLRMLYACGEKLGQQWHLPTNTRCRDRRTSKSTARLRNQDLVLLNLWSQQRRQLTTSGLLLEILLKRGKFPDHSKKSKGRAHTSSQGAKDGSQVGPPHSECIFIVLFHIQQAVLSDRGCNTQYRVSRNI